MGSSVKVILFFLMLITFSSCKQNGNQKDVLFGPIEETLPETTTKEKEPYFFITLKALFEKEDQIQLFYLQDQAEVYSPNQMILKDVTRKDTYQDIVIEMPKEDYPYNFRLDLSTNRAQTSIKIEECILNYGRKKFVIKGDDIKDYFILNDGVEIGSDPQNFKLKTYKELGKDKYDPFMVGNQKLNEVLLKNL